MPPKTKAESSESPVRYGLLRDYHAAAASAAGDLERALEARKEAEERIRLARQRLFGAQDQVRRHYEEPQPEAAMGDLTWKQAAPCEAGACVEIADGGFPSEDLVLVRSSLQPERTVQFTREEWDAFNRGRDLELVEVLRDTDRYHRWASTQADRLALGWENAADYLAAVIAEEV